MTNDKKIFLVEEKDDSDMEEEKYSGCLHFKIIKELTPEELELLKICLENNKADFEHEGCLPSHKVMFDRIENLLKKLETIQ